MKKIIALMLVLLLMLTMFVACKKDEGPATEEPSGENPSTEDPGDEEEYYWDPLVGGAVRPNQNDGKKTELPRVPVK